MVSFLLIVIEPALASSIDPDTFSFNSVLVEIVANARLFTSIPAAFVLAAILPNESAFAMTLIFLELTLILLTVRPDKMSISMHFIVKPLACVLFLVAPNVDAFALDLIHLELTLVHRSIGESELAAPIFLALVIFSFIYSAIRPCLQAKSVLFIVAP